MFLAREGKIMEDKDKTISELENRIKYMEGYIETVETARNELEQECEELKKSVEHWKVEHKEAKAKAEWTYDLVKKRLGQQLDQLKAENEELKEKLDFRTKKLNEDLSCSNECLRKRMIQCRNYRKALEEIEELANEHKNTPQYRGICQSILEIINNAKDINVPTKKDGE